MAQLTPSLSRQLELSSYLGTPSRRIHSSFGRLCAQCDLHAIAAADGTAEITPEWSRRENLSLTGFSKIIFSQHFVNKGSIP